MDFSWSKSVVSAILILSILSTVVVVDGKRPDRRIISGPNCTAKSFDKGFNKRVSRLLYIFVDETWNVNRSPEGFYRYNHSFPNTSPGSVTGGAICGKSLGRFDCRSCMWTAKWRISSHCEGGSIELKDCSIWYKKI